MQYSIAQAKLCSRLNIDLTDVQSGANSLFALAELQGFVKDGARQAWDYHPWTFTEKAMQTTIPSPYLGYIDYPTEFDDESVFLLIVNGLPWSGTREGKRIFADYQKWFGECPNDTSRLWTEFDRLIFINVNAIQTGQEVDVFGKLRCPKLVNDTDLLPFSPVDDENENSGNEAIVGLAYAKALASQKLQNSAGAMQEQNKALAQLDAVWKPMGERKAEKTSQGRPFFNNGDNYGERRRVEGTAPGIFLP